MAGVAIGGAALVGGIFSGVEAGNAANAENNASNNSLGLQQTEFNTLQAENAPYLASGTQNLATLNADMPSLTSPFTMQDFQEAPGYQFQLSQGEEAMQRSAAASGILDSVGTVQNLGNYAQGMANTDYQTALQNYLTQNQQKYNMLSGMAGMGQTAVSQNNAIGMNSANQQSAIMQNQGNAQAAGYIGTGNAINGTIGTGTNAILTNSLLNSLQNNNPYSGGGNLGSMPQIGAGAAPAAGGYNSSLGTYDF